MPLGDYRYMKVAGRISISWFTMSVICSDVSLQRLHLSILIIFFWQMVVRRSGLAAAARSDGVSMKRNLFIRSKMFLFSFTLDTPPPAEASSCWFKLALGNEAVSIGSWMIDFWNIVTSTNSSVQSCNKVGEDAMVAFSDRPWPWASSALTSPYSAYILVSWQIIADGC